MNPKSLILLSCALALPGSAMAKSHRHHHKPARHHRAAAQLLPNLEHVAAYAKGPGFGGALALEQPDGTVELAYFGEKADLRCGPAVGGPFTTCSKRNLLVGTPVAEAAHSVNTYGYDVWTSIDLVTDSPLTDPPPSDAPDGPGDTPPTSPPGDQPPAGPPAPEQQPAPPATGVVDSYDAGSRMLVFHRLNNNEKPSGRVADNASINCALVKDGKLAGMKTPCSTDDLVPGAQIAGANGALVDGVWTWTKIYLLIPGS